MLHQTKTVLNSSLLASLLLASAFALTALPARAQNGGAAKENDGPPFGDYKGVRIGMTADEARKKLGDPTDKGDTQDFYAVSDNETVQVFYDGEKKVHAISIIYMGGGSSMPTAKAVLGVDVEAKPDGSMHRRVDNSKAGFWVAYSRTSGDSPLVTITMQKK
jgi:outer membrane protein assembly factor BamE (lipoprotein component of BamABCDE complex)